MSTDRLSVVLPALDEAPRIRGRLRELVARRGVHEVIVVDGGSDDDTVDVARSVAGVQVLQGPRGRGQQMNLGARRATGELLLFLHVDCTLPACGIGRIHQVMDDPGVVAGAFRTRTVCDGPAPRWMRPLLPLADLRSHYTWHPYGDQAVFVRSSVFQELGGYREQALLEDLELARRLWSHGRVRVLADKVEVSARRYAEHPWRTMAVMNTFPVLYRLGVSTHTLARLYGNPR